MKTSLKRNSWSLAFALVFLPPQKEVEDWSSKFPTKSLEKEAWQEKLSSSSSSHSSQASANSSRFSFNGIDKLTFALNKGEKPQWEVSVPPIEFYRIWDSGAWSGFSLGARELHHFYTRAHRRGPEPKYRVYSLSAEREVIDFVFCSKKDALLLEKSLKAKEDSKISYQITQLKMLNSQELKRETSWSFDADLGQEFLSLYAISCGTAQQTVQLDGWPKSYFLKLN